MLQQTFIQSPPFSFKLLLWSPNPKRKIFFQMTFFLFFTYFQLWEFAYSSLPALGVKRMNWNKNSGITMYGFEYFGKQAHLTYCTKCYHKNHFVVTTIRIKVKWKNSARISHPVSSSNSTSVKFNRFVILLGDKTFRIFLYDVRVYSINQSINQSILIPPKIKRHALSYIYRLEEKKYVKHTVYK